MAERSTGTSFGGTVLRVEGEGWTDYAPGTAYRCEAYVLPAEGGVMATAAGLPGVSASGATEKEALDALAKALTPAIAERKQQVGGKMIWEHSEPPLGASVRYVLVRL